MRSIRAPTSGRCSMTRTHTCARSPYALCVTYGRLRDRSLHLTECRGQAGCHLDARGLLPTCRLVARRDAEGAARVDVEGHLDDGRHARGDALRELIEHEPREGAVVARQLLLAL